MIALASAWSWIADAWPDAAAAVVLAGVSAHWGSALWAKTTKTSRAAKGGHAYRRGWIAVLLMVLLTLPVVPFQGRRLSVASIAAGVLGDFSCLTVLLVITSYLPKPQPAKSIRLLLPLTSLGFLLYLSVLTYTGFDYYRLGYLHAELPTWQHWLLPTLLALWACILPLRAAILVSLACAAWTLGLQGSNNLWDYLLDVPLFLYALGQTLMWSRKQLAKA